MQIGRRIETRRSGCRSLFPVRSLHLCSDRSWLPRLSMQRAAAMWSVIERFTCVSELLKMILSQPERLDNVTMDDEQCAMLAYIYTIACRHLVYVHRIVVCKSSEISTPIDDCNAGVYRVCLTVKGACCQVVEHRLLIRGVFCAVPPFLLY